MKRVIVFLADGFEEIEALSPVDYLRRAGAEVLILSLNAASRNVCGAHKINVQADMLLDSYVSSNTELPDAVIIPGGMPGAVNIASCKQALALINEMTENKKLVASICASPAVVLSKTNALTAKKWTCYPGMQNEAQEFLSGYTKNRVETDGTLITACGPGAAEKFSMEVVRSLFDDATAKRISEAACHA